MLKTAQKRKILDRLRFSPAKALKKTFDPQFAEIFDHLEKTDDAARAILTGEEISGTHPGYEHSGISCKDLLKSAKTNLNRREYMSAIADIGRFHKKLADAVEILNNFATAAESKLEGVHKEFLFKDLPDERYHHISEFEKRLLAHMKSSIIKESGVIDTFHNVFSDRGKALAKWEKTYPKKTSYIKNKIKDMLSKSESTFNFILNVFRKMTVARAKSNISNYVELINNIKKNYSSYHEEWKKNYAGTDQQKDPGLKSIFDQMHGYVDSKSVKKDEDMGQPIVEPLAEPLAAVKHPSFPDLDVQKGQPFAPTLNIEEPVSDKSTLPEIPSLEVPLSKPKTESLPEIKPQAPKPAGKPKTKPAPPPAPPPSSSVVEPKPAVIVPKVEEVKKKSIHDNFMQSLETLSNESPLILRSYIKKYAEKISKTDPLTANRLFDIINRID